ncbi:WD repeat-containing protein 6, partial [Coemansia erecta]
MSLLLAGTSHLPVTAIEFLNNNKVLAGSGNQLFLYDLTSGTLILKLRVFAYSRIYGVISQQNCQQTSSESPQVWQVLVFGSKDWAVVEIKETTAYKVVGHCAVNWIKAAHWVYCLQRNKWLAVLASAHNKAFLCDPYTGETLASAQCEERCILYSAAFYGRELDNLVVASGTVFNHVLLWRPCWSEINDSLVEKRMQAHEGVVFSVAFNRDGSELVSASDDRTLRVWDLSKNSDEDDCLVATLYGHQARVWSGIALKEYIVSASEDGSCRVWARDGKNCGFSAKDSWKQCKKNVWTMAVNDSEELVVSGAADGSICVWSIGSIAGKHLQTTSSLDSIIDLPAQADYLPHSVAAARKSEHIRNFALYSCSGTDPGIITVMDSGCVLQKLPKGDWKMLCFLPGFAGYSMLASTLSGDLIAVGMRDGS